MRVEAGSAARLRMGALSASQTPPSARLVGRLLPQPEHDEVMEQHILQICHKVDLLGEEPTGATVTEHTHMENLSHHNKNTVVGFA
jgi:hypothetical protein